jgi:hypothetical protein
MLLAYLIPLHFCLRRVWIRRSPTRRSPSSVLRIHIAMKGLALQASLARHRRNRANTFSPEDVKLLLTPPANPGDLPCGFATT